MSGRRKICASEISKKYSFVYFGNYEISVKSCRERKFVQVKFQI